MFGTRRQLQLAHWLILFALVLATLAPGISRAMAFAKGDAFLQGVICSVQPVGQAQGEAPGQAAATHEDCPYCALRADTLAPRHQAGGRQQAHRTAGRESADAELFAQRVFGRQLGADRVTPIGDRPFEFVGHTQVDRLAGGVVRGRSRFCRGRRDRQRTRLHGRSRLDEVDGLGRRDWL